jgi:long-chain-fatty-acid--CoA ligase ACSBG
MAEEKGENTNYVVNASDEIQIRMDESGAGAEEPITICNLMKKTCENVGDKLALTSADGKRTLTYNQYNAECRKFAKSLIALDVQPFEGVNMIGYNSIEYVVSNVGAIFAGCVAAGIYTTNDAEASHYVAEHSDAAIVVCDGLKQLNKFLAVQDRLPKLKALVMYNIAYEKKGVAVPPAELPERPEGCVPLYTFEQFMELGAEVAEEAVDARMNAQKPGNCCTLIYTSGTTGNPKAVMISHDNITWTAKRLQEKMDISANDRLVSYLPLNHIAAQMLDIHAPMAFGCSVFFADPDALRGSLKTTLVAALPTIFFGVPRVWEKMQEAMVKVGLSTTGCKKKISTWAKGKGTEYTAALQYGASGNPPCCYGCASSIVFSKVKAALGMTNLRLASTGAAPIQRHTLDYFGQLDIHIMELFGQSECTGPATFNAPGFWKLGTCGQKLDGTEMIIVPETKEIIYRGRHIMMGYMKEAEKSADTIDAEGYLHSGDQGAIDEDGFMKIIGRIKELIIGAGGENIAPVPIEERLLKQLPILSNAAVIGDKRKFLTVLVTLKSEVDIATGEPKQELTEEALAIAKELGSKATTVAEAAECEKINAYIENGLKESNKGAPSNAHTLKKFSILPCDFSVPGGELTSTLKLRRSELAKKYDEVIEAFYA